MRRTTVKNIIPYIWWGAIDEQMSYGACVSLRMRIHELQVSLMCEAVEN